MAVCDMVFLKIYQVVEGESNKGIVLTHLINWACIGSFGLVGRYLHTGFLWFTV